MRPVAATCFAVVVAILASSCDSVTALAPAPVGGTPTLSSLSPSSGRVGTAVVVRGSDFSSSRNHVHFGLGYVANLPSSDGTTLRFVVPDTLSPCPPDSSDPCATVLVKVTAGAYQVAVVSDGSTSDTTTVPVTQ